MIDLIVSFIINNSKTVNYRQFSLNYGSGINENYSEIRSNHGVQVILKMKSVKSRNLRNNQLTSEKIYEIYESQKRSMKSMNLRKDL